MSTKRRRSPSSVPTTIAELLALARQSTQFADCELLPVIEPALRQLEQLVGLKDIKRQICELVVMRLQQRSLAGSLPALGHIVVFGPPGSGKTTLAGILARLLAGLGCLSSGHVVEATASSLIAGFVGQTAPKTEAVVRSAFGGVLLIDEASSLVDGRSDSFAKNALDTLNRMLTEYGSYFVCILAGYEADIQRDVFSVNPGLRRRFGTVFKIPPYTQDEMLAMLHRKLLQRQLFWAKDVRLQSSLSGASFEYQAGDVETLVDKIVVQHALAVFGQAEKRFVSQAELERGLQVFRQHVLTRSSSDPASSSSLSMYL